MQIKIPQPKWSDPIVSKILFLEKLRDHILIWEIQPHIFFELKNIIQTLEVAGSSRIEWNNTTLNEYIEQTIENEKNKNTNEWFLEMQNLKEAIIFIEENTTRDKKIDRAYISELHKIVTKNLHKEWSSTPWDLRKINVKIKWSNHVPPDFLKVPEYFEQFLNFINKSYNPQDELLMISISHHAFAYIHPFDNWNWRVGRLLTYALLIKYWFDIHKWKLINPSSVFYSDRDKYYEMLWEADSLEEKSLLSWCNYYVSWIKNEIEKIDSLCKKDYVVNKVIIPSMKNCLEKKIFKQEEYDILLYTVKNENMSIKSEELGKFWYTTSLQKSRAIKSLRNKKLLKPIKQNSRIYSVNFTGNYWMREVIEILRTEGFVSDFLNNNI